MNGPLAILGPGTLGLSAAQWAVECGLETRLLGRTLDHAQAGVQAIHRRWDRALVKGFISAGVMRNAKSRLQPCAFGPASLTGASALLEAVPEDPELKVPVLRAAAEWGPSELLLLSGTSALPIGDLAVKAGLVGRLVGFHLFVPVPKMAVVEMAVPAGTAQSWIDLARSLGDTLKKRVVQVRDQPGFAAARMALAQGLEAIRLLEDGVASAEDLDALLTLGYGHPVGPLELTDRVGLDLRLRILEGLVEAGENRFEPPAGLRKKVADGATGLKARCGYYFWDDGGKRT